MNKGASKSPHGHVVKFYEHQDELVHAAVDHLVSGLCQGSDVVVIATTAHIQEIESALAAVEDVDRLRSQDHYMALDASTMLSTFVVDGSIDVDRFQESMSAITTGRKNGSPLRVFGEMVALLWEQGSVLAAIELEELWDPIIDANDIELLCAYPVSAASQLGPARQMCQLHGDVFPPTSYNKNAIDCHSAMAMAESSRVFLPVPDAGRVVRCFVRETLASWGCDEVIIDAELVVSELFGNALVHADSPFRVQLSHQSGGVKVSVHDADTSEPYEASAGPEDVGGRGVAMVAALSDRWGVERVADGKIVWAELRVNTSTSAPLVLSWFPTECSTSSGNSAPAYVSSGDSPEATSCLRTPPP